MEEPESGRNRQGANSPAAGEGTDISASVPLLNIGEWGVLAGLSAEDLKSVSNVAEVWARIALALAEDRGLFK